MKTKVYKKGANLFIDNGNGEIKRIPTAYTAYDIKNENVIIHNLINDNTHSIPISGITDEKGNSIDKTDDYLSGIVGSFN